MEELNYAIGGYFELELNKNSEYHRNAVRLNTGRNALEYILDVNNYRKIYLPYFTCDVLLQPIKSLEIEFEFYNINEQFEPVFDYSKVQPVECFLYTNYFGLKDSFVKQLSKKCKNVIIDNAQSFYSKPIDNVDTFYSPRKFFGIPDGAYLYTSKRIENNLAQDFSYERFEHLLKRIDTSAEDGYSCFSLNDEKLNNLPILKMSNLTKRMLESIDYNTIAKKRIDNYLFLDEKLRKLNKLKIDFNQKQVPMVYPFWGNDELRKKLIKNRIYCAKYWPNVKEWTKPNALEYKLAEEVIYFPIDQRYEMKDMELIVNIIFNV
jgi:hypothetical protein